MNDDSCTISTVDFPNRTIKEKLTVEHDKGLPQFLRQMAELVAKHNVQSVIIVTIENGNECDHFWRIKDEAQKTLLTVYMEEVREDLKREIFNDADMGDTP